MPDISSLGLRDLTPIDYDKYETSSGPSAPPHAGRYLGRAPETIEFSAGKDGQLIAVVDPITIADGEREGYPVRFTRVSNKPPKNSKTGGTQNRTIMDDYLRAHGIDARPTSHQEYADLVESTVGRTFQFDGDWEAYCKGCGKSIARHETEFPLDAAGNHVPQIKCVACSSPDNEVVVRANFRIARFVSAL